MEHGRYLPKDDAGKNLWLKNFSSKLADYTTLLELDPDEVVYMQKASAYFNYLLGFTEQLDNYTKAVYAYKKVLRDGNPNATDTMPVLLSDVAPDAVGAGIFTRVSKMVSVIKNHAKYNQTIGISLGLVGTEVTIDFTTAKPLVKAEVKNSHAYIGWVKGHAQAAHIKADYGEGNGFAEVAQINSNHFLDPHLPPAGESRIYKYMVRYVFHDEEVGEWSDEVSITITGI